MKIDPVYFSLQPANLKLHLPLSNYLIQVHRMCHLRTDYRAETATVWCSKIMPINSSEFQVCT